MKEYKGVFQVLQERLPGAADIKVVEVRKRKRNA